MNDPADRLLAGIAAHAGKTRRVPLDDLWSEFLSVFPHLKGAAVARAELLDLLESLARGGAIRMPKAKQLYDRVQQPALPRWIELPAPAQQERPLEIARRTAWHPMLEFVPALSRLAAEELEALLKIQRFLASLDPAETVLTVRERSLRLFGDEKRLERLLDGPLFATGRLSIDALCCYLVHVPFVHRDFGAGEDALIIENKDTYASACRARAALTDCRIRWLVFGYGNAILSSYLSMLDWPATPRRVLYFGDLDRRGLEIAVGLRKSLGSDPSLPGLLCAQVLYERLVERAVGDQHDSAPALAPSLAELVAWLPEPIRPASASLLDRKGQWPQEWVTERDFAEILPRT